VRLRGLALKLLVGALPVCEVAAIGLAFLDPDAIGAFSDPLLVGPVGALGRRRLLFARCPFAGWRLGHEVPSSRDQSRSARSRRIGQRALRQKVPDHG